MNDQRFDALVAALRDVAHRDYEIPLEHPYDALQIVVAAVEALGTTEAHESVTPLRQLIVALSDRLRGGDPELLRPPKVAKGRPVDTSFAVVQGAVAGAMEVMMSARNTCPTREAAARHVAARAWHFGLRDRSKTKITWQQVASWRDRAGGDLADAATAVFSNYAEIKPESDDAAKELVDGILFATATAGLARGKILGNPPITQD